jgi:hypothetical protein
LGPFACTPRSGLVTVLILSACELQCVQPTDFVIDLFFGRVAPSEDEIEQPAKNATLLFIPMTFAR